MPEGGGTVAPLREQDRFAANEVVLGVGHDTIVAVATVDVIDFTVRGEDDVVGLATQQPIGSASAIQLVGSLAPGEKVMPRPSEQVVRAG